MIHAVGRTDEHEEANRRFSRLKRTRFPKGKQAVEGGYCAIRNQARKTIHGVFTSFRNYTTAHGRRNLYFSRAKTPVV